MTAENLSWAWPTNYSNGTDYVSVDGVSKFFFKYPAYLVGDTYYGGIVLIIWLFSFVLSMAAGVFKAITVSSFITLIFAVLIMREGGLNLIIIFGLVFMLIVGIIGSLMEN